jgi:hypothetical protein
VSWRRDSAGVMYGARGPSDGTAGYHSETISSRAFTPAAQGSGREVSVRYKDVVPTGLGPVGSGRLGAEVPMPPIITDPATARHPAQPGPARPGRAPG